MVVHSIVDRNGSFCCFGCRRRDLVACFTIERLLDKFCVAFRRFRRLSASAGAIVSLVARPAPYL